MIGKPRKGVFNSIPRILLKTSNSLERAKMSDGYGVLRAVTRVYLTDIFGNQVARRINIGVKHYVDLLEARVDVEKARMANPGMDIRAEFKVLL